MVSSMPSDPIPALGEPTQAQPAIASPTSSSGSHLSDDESLHAQRPKLGSRKSSGSMIIPRDSQKVEMAEDEEQYDADDVRSMSPRRSTEDVAKLGDDARKALMEQAQELQRSLMAIVDRIETAKEEHEKLEGGNKFLQSYIGELIQTSKITSSSGVGKSKGKSRNTK